MPRAERPKTVPAADNLRESSGHKLLTRDHTWATTHLSVRRALPLYMDNLNHGNSWKRCRRSENAIRFTVASAQRLRESDGVTPPDRAEEGDRRVAEIFGDQEPDGDGRDDGDADGELQGVVREAEFRIDVRAGAVVEFGSFGRRQGRGVEGVVRLGAGNPPASTAREQVFQVRHHGDGHPHRPAGATRTRAYRRPPSGIRNMSSGVHRFVEGSIASIGCVEVVMQASLLQTCDIGNVSRAGERQHRI